MSFTQSVYDMIYSPQSLLGWEPGYDGWSTWTKSEIGDIQKGRAMLRVIGRGGKVNGTWVFLIPRSIVSDPSQLLGRGPEPEL